MDTASNYQPLEGTNRNVIINPYRYGWLPSSISNLYAWYRADLYGGTATQWDDISGNGRHATEATNYPTFNASGGSGDQAYFEFDGTNDKFGLAQASFGTVSQPSTVCVVFKSDATTGIRTIMDSTNLSARQAIFVPYTYDRLASFAGTLVGTTAVGTTSWHYAVVNFDSVTSFIRQDGVLVNTGNPGTMSLGGISIGSYQSGTGNFFDGRLSELIIFDKEVSGDELTALETYLATRYAI